MRGVKRGRGAHRQTHCSSSPEFELEESKRNQSTVAGIKGGVSGRLPVCRRRCHEHAVQPPREWSSSACDAGPRRVSMACPIAPPGWDIKYAAPSAANLRGRGAASSGWMATARSESLDCASSSRVKLIGPNRAWRIQILSPPPQGREGNSNSKVGGRRITLSGAVQTSTYASGVLSGAHPATGVSHAD